MSLIDFPSSRQPSSSSASSGSNNYTNLPRRVRTHCLQSTTCTIMSARFSDPAPQRHWWRLRTRWNDCGPGPSASASGARCGCPTSAWRFSQCRVTACGVSTSSNWTRSSRWRLVSQRAGQAAAHHRSEGASGETLLPDTHGMPGCGDCRIGRLDVPPRPTGTRSCRHRRGNRCCVRGIAIFRVGPVIGADHFDRRGHVEWASASSRSSRCG